MENILQQSPNAIYYVQIAPWKSEGNDKLDWAWFRQCQLELMSAVPNVGMVTTGDAGSENFIHSPYKIKVGERLAYWALAKRIIVKVFNIPVLYTNSTG